MVKAVFYASTSTSPIHGANHMISSQPKPPIASPQLPSGPTKPALLAAVQELLEFVGDKALNSDLETQLNERFGATTDRFANLLALLRRGIVEGWACYSEITGPDYRRGRIAEASDSTHGFTVESGRLRDVLGNYHRHPRGEINMIGPVDETGKFCGSGAGWRVFPPGSSHFPTVSGGTVTLLFFLPRGEIEYMEPPTLQKS
jgi:2-hydroxylaminobenzoate mutase